MKNKLIVIVLILLVFASMFLAIMGRKEKHKTSQDFKVREQIQTIDSAGTDNGMFIREKVKTLDSTCQYIK